MSFDQFGFRFYIDDGEIGDTTPLKSENTNTIIGVGNSFRLRVGVALMKLFLSSENNPIRLRDGNFLCIEE